MYRKSLCLALLSMALICSAQEKSPAPQVSKTDYSQEAFVVEKQSTSYRFESDGTGIKRSSGRYRVQSEAALQQLGQLVFGYNSANQKLKINYVRVIKSDGTVITADESAVQDMTTPIAREAPIYSDLRQKHVTVPALRPGEVLEFEIEVQDFQPLVAGEFWMDHSFEKNAISLDETLEVNVPENKRIFLKTEPQYPPKITIENGRKIYRWTAQHLEREDKEKEAKKPKQVDRSDVALTTFVNWNELAAWYAGLEKDRRAATPEMTAKVQELIKNAKTDREKAEAIYDYVSQNFRYVSLSFGVGRYQPHTAAEIYSNQYGDCKDKHTLLAAMLGIAGIPTDTVLIHSSRKLDQDLPSPSQFDHVISAVHLGNERVILDTTEEIAPFGGLWAVLRNKSAVLVTPDGKAEVIKTPVDFPIHSVQRVEMEGKITELGRLERQVKYTTRGDLEMAFRTIFRRVPQPQWKDVLENLITLDGLRGEVSDIKISSIGDTRNPFVLEFKLVTPNYVNFSSKKSKIEIPLPLLRFPTADEDDVEPVKLGSKTDIDLVIKLTVPDKFKLSMPVPVTMKRDYAEYASSYKFENGLLTASREVKTMENEIPASRASDFNAFASVVRNDAEQNIGVELSEVDAASAPKDAKVDEVDEAARAAFNSHNYPQAITLYKRVVELEPKHKFAWNNLGRAYLNSNKLDEAEAAFKKQVEVNAYDQYAYNNLGLTYQRKEMWAEAEVAFRKQIEVNPLDQYSHRNLGTMLTRRHRYEDAIPELEKAISITGEDVFTEQQLGDAYLKTGKVDKALETFDKVVKQAPVPPMWNNIAYALAEQGTALDRAQKYAESAVSMTEASLNNLPAERLMEVGAQMTSSLVTYWDTLGWVYFRQGNLDEAEKYIAAAWESGQDGEVGDHLAQIYEKRGEKQKAIDMYAKSLAAKDGIPETRARLATLLGDPKKVDPLVNKMRPLLGEERTLRMKAAAENDGSAEFKVLLRGSSIEQVAFDKGKKDLSKMENELRAAKFPEFQTGTNTRMFRRVIVDCSKMTKKCTSVLMTTSAAAMEEVPTNVDQFLEVTNQKPKD